MDGSASKRDAMCLCVALSVIKAEPRASALLHWLFTILKNVYLERRRGGVSVHVAINPFPAFGQLVAAGLAAVAVAERGVKRNADLLHRGYETERETERARVRIRECDSEKIGHRKVTRPTERASDRER